jgi:hypothetical protein
VPPLANGATKGAAKETAKAVHPLVDALRRPYPCECGCRLVLTRDERLQGITALFRFDDAMRGWGYEPLYTLAADGLYREAQAKADASYRGVAVRDSPCLYRRLVGFAIHEIGHALGGDTSLANYGIPWGLPYAVPEWVPRDEAAEAAFVEPYNRVEARAWLGVDILGAALFGIDWELANARDVGTYGLYGGNAIVPPPPGFRAVPHWDSVHHAPEYYRRARRLEMEERAFFTEARVADMALAFEAAEAKGRAARKIAVHDAAEVLVDLPPRMPGGNDACICGSGQKFKRCCGPRA